MTPRRYRRHPPSLFDSDNEIERIATIVIVVAFSVVVVVLGCRGDRRYALPSKGVVMARSTKYGEVTVEHEPGNALNGTDEPVFLFRARDGLLVGLLQIYREMRIEDNPGQSLDSLDDDIAAIAEWQSDHRDLVKSPD